jgi:hypothetical protein
MQVRPCGPAWMPPMQNGVAVAMWCLHSKEWVQGLLHRSTRRWGPRHSFKEAYRSALGANQQCHGERQSVQSVHPRTLRRVAQPEPGPWQAVLDCVAHRSLTHPHTYHSYEIHAVCTVHLSAGDNYWLMILCGQLDSKGFQTSVQLSSSEGGRAAGLSCLRDTNHCCCLWVVWVCCHSFCWPNSNDGCCCAGCGRVRLMIT